MGYIQPTAMGAKGAASGSAQTPGMIDKIFNTTFGIVQQPLWRIWRALKDDDIDILSQQGILDPALLPILGFAFDNKNTVMADELFGDNLGAQIAGSILTDPLSFMTGGATAAAKAAKAAQKGLVGGAKKKGVKAMANDTTEAFHRAANYGAGRLDDVGQVLNPGKGMVDLSANTKVSEMLSGINHAKKNGGFLDEAGRMLGKSLTPGELNDLTKLGDKLGGLSDDLLGGSLDNLLAQSKKREMGLGLPLLGDFFGMYVAPPKWLSKHGGWMKWYMNTVKEVYAKPARLTGKMVDPVMRMSPFLARQADKTKQVVQQFGKGVKEGPISKAVLNYLQDGASPLVNGSDGALMAASTATKVYNQAYVKAAGGNLALSNHAVPITEHVAKLADDLVGEAATNNLTFNQQVQRRFGEDAAKSLFPGRASEADSIEAFKANMNSFLYNKEAGAINTKTMTWDDDLMRATTSSEQSLAYRMGRSTRIFYNKMFKNDLGLNGAEELNRFQRRIEAQNSQHQEAMAHRFYSKVEELVEVSGKSHEAVNQIVFARMSLTTSAHEIHAFADYLNGGGTTTVKQWSKELNEFLGGRVNSNLDYLKGTAAENMRGGTEALDNLLKDLDAGVSKAIHLDELGTGGRAGALTFEQNLGKIEEMTFSSGRNSGRAITSFEPAELFGGSKESLSKLDLEEGVFGGLKRDLDELNAKLADPDQWHHEELLDQKAYLEGDIAALVRWRGQVEDLKDFKVSRPELTGVMNPMGELVEHRLRPTVFKKVNFLGEFKDGTKVTLNNIGKAFGDAPEDITGLANVISRLRTRQAALDKYSDLHGNLLDNTPQNIPQAFIEGFEKDLIIMDGLMRDALIKPLSVGKDGASHKVAEELFDMLDSQRDATRLIALQNNIVPHSATPLGYMPRILSGTEFNVVHKALNDFVGDSEGLKDLLSPTLAATRQARSFSVQDINHLETVLKKLPENTQGLDDMVNRVTDMRVKLTGSADFKKYTEDPAAALVAHHAQMSKALQDQKWFEFIGEQGGKYGIQQGRVVDVILGTPKSVPLVRGTKPVLREQGGMVTPIEGTGKLTPISVGDYTSPSTARTTWANAENSAASLLGGVRVSNAGKTDFEMLMPDNYWVRDGHEAVEGAYEAKGALRHMYDKGLLNETGVLMTREAIRQNPALMRNLKDTTFSQRAADLMETMTGLGASKQTAQTVQARHMLASIGMATMKGMDEMNELGSARASFIRENGEKGFVDWAMKNFSASSSQARAAMRSDEHFAGMITASALTKVGEEGLEQAGLGKFVKSFQRQMKQVLSRVIATFTGGKKGFMDYKMHSELATQLEQTVKGALNLSDSAADAVLNTQARRGVIDFISSSYHNALKPMVDARMRDLGIADGFAPFAARTADDRADMLLHALDYRNVAANLGVKGLKELEKYLDQASTMPRFSYEDGSHLAGLSKQTEWSDEATTTMADVLEEVKLSSRSSASAEGVEGSVSYFDWLDSMTGSLSGRNVRQQIEASDPDALERLNISPYDPMRGNLAETDQLDFLLPGMSPSELKAAGLNAKWVDGGLSFEKSVLPGEIRPNRESLPMNPLTKIRAVMASFDDKLDKLAKEQRPDMTIPTTKPRRVQVGDEGSPGTWKVTRKTEESTELRVDPRYWRWEEGAGSVPGQWRFDHELYRKSPPTRGVPKQKTLKEVIEEGGGLKHNIDAEGTLTGTGMEGKARVVGKGGRKSTAQFQDADGKWHDASFHIDDGGEIVWAPNVGETAGLTWGQSAKGNDFPPFWGTGKVSAGDDVARHWSFNYDTGKYEGRVQFEGRMVDGEWVDDIHPFRMEEVPLNQEQLDHIENVITPNINSHVKTMEDTMAKRAAYLKKVEARVEKARKIVEKRTAKQYQKQTIKEFNTNIKILDAVIDDLTLSPQISARQDAVDFVAHAKLNHKDIQRISHELIGEGVGMTKAEITAFQTRLYRQLGSKNEALDAANARHGGAEATSGPRYEESWQEGLDEADTPRYEVSWQEGLDEADAIGREEDALYELAEAQRKVDEADTPRYEVSWQEGLDEADAIGREEDALYELAEAQRKVDELDTPRYEVSWQEGLDEAAAIGREEDALHAAKLDRFTEKELAFIDEVSSNPALLRMVDEGRLSTTAAFPAGAKYAAKHATRLKELKAIRSDTAAHKALFEKNFTVDRFLEEADNIGSARVGAEDTPFQPVADIIEEGRQKISDLRGGIPKTGQAVADEFSTTGEFFDRTRQAQKATAAATNKVLNKYPDLANLSRKTLEDVTEEGASSSVTPYSFAENGNMPPRGGEVPPTAPLLNPKSLSQPAGAGWQKGTPGAERRVMLEVDEVERIKEHVPYMVVIEKADGTRVQVPSTLFDVPEYSMVSLGHGRDINAALRDSSRRGGRAILKGANADASSVSQMMGHQVSIGPQGVNGAIQGQLKTQTPGKMAAAFKWYDNIHTLMKYMATSLRLPLDFHTANIVSSIPQALMEDIGATNMIQGMLATGRLFGKDADEILGMAKASAVIQGGKINPAARKQPFSKFFTVLHDVGERGRFKAGSTRGSAEIAEGSEALIYRGGGNAHHYDDIIAAMVEEGAFDTMVRADFVQMKNADTAVEHIRNMYAGRKTSGFSKAMEAKDRFAELSELFVRMSAMHGAINAGMDLRTAAKSVSRAMVDYSDITQIEKAGLKRLGFFYTFPRKMIPKSLEYLFNNPSKGGALLNNLIKDKEHVKTSEGRVEIAIGDKRVNVGRLAPQIDSMVALASVADTFLPALGNMIPYGDPRPRRMTGEAAPDRPLSPSGILNIAGWEQFLPTEDPLSGSMDWLEEASRANWAIKMLTGEVNLLGSRDPEVEYSPLESLARTVTPYRKVRPAQEEQQMIRRINSHKRRYKRELEEATTAGNVTAIEAYTEYIEQMDSRVLELQRIVDDAAVRPPNPYAE